MEPNEYDSGGGVDISPAVPLEISADLAARVDAILQDFAEGAELETALVVERSGALVSGISSEAEVMVDVISALVAGASAAMNALVRELGSTGNIESFHQSEARAVYLAEIMDGFVLVGVSTVPVPVGVIREKARRIRPALVDLLQEVEIPAPPSLGSAPRKFSLRDAALVKYPGMFGPGAVSKAAEDVESAEMPTLPGDDESSHGGAAEPVPAGMVPAGMEESTGVEEAGGSIFEAVDEDEDEEFFIPDATPPEPTEVIEFLRDEGPGIVIEDASGAVIDSPFEAEDDYGDEEVLAGGPGDSIFELEDDGEEEEEAPALPAAPAAAVPGIDPLPEEALGEGPGEFFAPDSDGDTAEETGVVFEIEEEDEETTLPPGESFPFFEIDEEAAAGEGGEAAFELDLDDFQDDDEDDGTGPVDDASLHERESEVEEDEVPSSGPFYF